MKHFFLKTVFLPRIIAVVLGAGAWWLPHAQATQIEAENYAAMSGVQVEICDEGGQDVGYIHNGDWVEYTINVPMAGEYRFDFRVASDSDGGAIGIVAAGVPIGTVSVGHTGGWQTWSTVSMNAIFSSAGTQTLRLNFSGGTSYLLNLNWFSYAVPSSVTLTIGNQEKQIMKYGLDYERLWFWYGPQANLNAVAQWSVVDCDVDYLRVAINCEYELTEGVYNLRAYTDKIIPMMTAMKAANPNIKFFGSPRPLNEAESGADWQPYPRWITGQAANGGAFNFNPTKCAQYLVRYLILMNSYGFKITYLDVSNEWQSNSGTSRVTPSDAQVIRNYLLANLPANIPMPLLVAPSAWSFSQGASWINAAHSQGYSGGYDLAASHNTGDQGTAQDFATAAQNLGKEVWDSEVHGWKGKVPADEIPTSFEMFDRIRAGFSGLDSWLAIGTPAQQHCYILNNGTTVTRNVKYYIFRKLSTTSNYGHALDVNQPAEFTSTAALIRGNLLTLWVLNNSAVSVTVDFKVTGWSLANLPVQRTRWNAALPLSGLSDYVAASSTNQVQTTIAGNSLYCFEITLASTNVPPSAATDNTHTTRNTAVAVNVLANDNDPSGHPLSVASFTQGARGTVSHSGGGTLTYAPNVNYTGTDSFHYTVTNGQGGTNTANVSVSVYPAGSGPYWTNLLATTEAYIRGGSYAADDQDEAGSGYLAVKYNDSNNDFSRKTYFQFDLTGLNVSSSTQAVLNLGFANTFQQNVQLWALNQAYPGFASTVTWNTAQANERSGNNLLTEGAFTATPVGSVTNIPASGTTPQSFEISAADGYLKNHRLTLALSGAPDDGIYVNHSSGLRLLLQAATLQVLVLPPVPPEVANPPVVTSIAPNPDDSMTLKFQGDVGVLYGVQAATALPGPWEDVSTNVVDSSGVWTFTDSMATNWPERFYRVLRP